LQKLQSNRIAFSFAAHHSVKCGGNAGAANVNCTANPCVFDQICNYWYCKYYNLQQLQIPLKQWLKTTDSHFSWDGFAIVVATRQARGYYFSFFERAESNLFSFCFFRYGGARQRVGTREITPAPVSRWILHGVPMSLYTDILLLL
jgi:hypothetical protein